MFGLFRGTKFLHRKVPFNLADIGEGISEVQILQWFVKEGAQIKQFEKIAEVQSDKATVEITSRFDGVVTKLHYNVNDMAKVGEPLIDIDTEDSPKLSEQKSEEKVSEKAEEPAKRDEKKIEKGTGQSEYLMMPSVRKFVHENNVDLSKLNFSQKRITKEDILKATQNDKFSDSKSDGLKEILMNPVQKAMIRAMEKSLKIPHFGYSDEYKMDNLVMLRQAENEKNGQGKISMLPFIVKAAGLALKEFPTINAHFLEGKLFNSSSINIGVAIDTPQGLVVPVLKNVQNLKGVREVAEMLKDLTDRARKNKLNQDEFDDATFTVSNIGSIGGTYASPCIVAPQVCIVAIGKIRNVAVFTESGAVEPQKLAAFSFSADHRAVDGATMARFSNRIKELLENPSELMN